MCISFGGFLREILAIGGRGDDEVAAGGGFWWWENIFKKKVKVRSSEFWKT